MGRERECEASFGDESGRVVAHIDADNIVLRGDFSAKVPLASLKSLSVNGEQLLGSTERGALTLLLGEKEARAWLLRIKDPPSLSSKLGIEAGSPVHVAEDHPVPIAVLKEAGARLVSPEDAKLIFLVVESQAHLEALGRLAAARPPSAQIWVLRLRGKHASIKEAPIMECMRRHGMAPSKTAAWSDRYAADRYGTARKERS